MFQINENIPSMMDVFNNCVVSNSSHYGYPVATMAGPNYKCIRNVYELFTCSLLMLGRSDKLSTLTIGRFAE